MLDLSAERSRPAERFAFRPLATADKACPLRRPRVAAYLPPVSRGPLGAIYGGNHSSASCWLDLIRPVCKGASAQPAPAGPDGAAEYRIRRQIRPACWPRGMLAPGLVLRSPLVLRPRGSRPTR